MENLQPLLQTMASGVGSRGSHKTGAWKDGGVITALWNGNNHGSGMVGPLLPPVNASFNNYPQSSMSPPMKTQQTYQQMSQMRQLG
jgi:hypothetical protein